MTASARSRFAGIVRGAALTAFVLGPFDAIMTELDEVLDGGATHILLTFGSILAVMLLGHWAVVCRTEFLAGMWEASGRCSRCGYDLRATPDRCPECGPDSRGDVPVGR